MKRIYIILFITFFARATAFSQTEPMYSQYMHNQLAINPAYAGNRSVPSLAFIWREQWAGMPGAPSTKSITFDMPTENKKVGFGIQLFDDKYVNVIHRTGLNLYYNLKFPVSDNLNAELRPYQKEGFERAHHVNRNLHEPPASCNSRTRACDASGANRSCRSD